jgi:hypothetical protein
LVAVRDDLAGGIVGGVSAFGLSFQHSVDCGLDVLRLKGAGEPPVQVRQYILFGEVNVAWMVVTAGGCVLG